MGCAQSRIENEDSVKRCKDRRNLMKDAVVARNTFAAGHSGYAVALKNTGAALSDYGHREAVMEPHHQLHPPPPPPPQDPTTPLPPPSPHIDEIALPPPPLPNFSPSSSPIKRAVSMPAIPSDRKPGRRGEIGSLAINEEEEEEEVEEVEVEDDEERLHERERHVTNVVRNQRKQKTVMGFKVDPADINHNMGTPSPPPPPPPMPEAKNMGWDYFFMLDNMQTASSLDDAGPANDIDNNNNNNNNNNKRSGNEDNVKISTNNVVYNDEEEEPKTPERVEVKGKMEMEMEAVKMKQKQQQQHQIQIEHSNTAPASFVKTVISSVSMMQVLSEIDDHFLKASQSAQEVSKMLEATRLHYHSNFADNRGIF